MKLLRFQAPEEWVNQVPVLLKKNLTVQEHLLISASLESVHLQVQNHVLLIIQEVQVVPVQPDRAVIHQVTANLQRGLNIIIQEVLQVAVAQDQRILNPEVQVPVQVIHDQAAPGQVTQLQGAHQVPGAQVATNLQAQAEVPVHDLHQAIAGVAQALVRLQKALQVQEAPAQVLHQENDNLNHKH